MVNSLKKHLWRIAATHTYEEAMQEAYVMFLDCARRYPDLDTAQHFMALFQVSWHNQLHDLSKRATSARATCSLEQLSTSVEDGGSGAPMEFVGDTENDGFLSVMLRQAPSEVSMVLSLFLNAPSELLELAMQAWRRSGNYKSDGDRAVSHLLGLPAGSTPITATKEYFGDN